MRRGGEPEAEKGNANPDEWWDPVRAVRIRIDNVRDVRDVGEVGEVGEVSEVSEGQLVRRGEGRGSE